MFVYGGRFDRDICIPEPFNQGIKLFDLFSLEWTTEFEFMNGQAQYQVPGAVYDVIGGGYVSFHVLLSLLSYI